MYKLISITLCCCILAIVESSHIGLVGPSAPGVVLQGPGSKASLIGPDGSHIVGAVAGGTVVRPPIPGGVVNAIGVVSPVVYGYGHGHEGQYIHDYTETLYDDGSYKGDYYDEHY